MPSKKKYNARFAPARIKKIMQSDEEVGKVASAVPVIISKALEMFLDSFLENADKLTKERSAKTLTPQHLKLIINTDSKYDFLKDLVTKVPDLGPDEVEDEPKEHVVRKKRRHTVPEINGQSEVGSSSSKSLNLEVGCSSSKSLQLEVGCSSSNSLHVETPLACIPIVEPNIQETPSTSTSLDNHISEGKQTVVVQRSASTDLFPSMPT